MDNKTPPDFVAEFCAKMEEHLAPFGEVGEDMRRNIRAVAEAVFAKMNVVGRAEFDEQNALLAEALEKLAEMEATVAAMQAAQKAAKKPPAAPRHRADKTES